MVRLRSTAPPVAALLGALVLAICAQGVARGHTGGLAQDGCHRVADTDTRHAHAEGTVEPAWFCVEEDDGTVRVPIDPAPAAAADTTIGNLTETIAAQALGLIGERDRLRARVVELEADLADAGAAHERTVTDLAATVADLADRERQLADLNARWAERPSARCRNAVQALLELDPGWFDGVKIDDEQRAELRAACLDGN